MLNVGGRRRTSAAMIFAVTGNGFVAPLAMMLFTTSGVRVRMPTAVLVSCAMQRRRKEARLA